MNVYMSAKNNTDKMNTYLHQTFQNSYKHQNVDSNEINAVIRK